MKFSEGACFEKMLVCGLCMEVRLDVVVAEVDLDIQERKCLMVGV